MFQRGATGQAAVLHSWVQMQPVDHVVDTGGGGGVIFIMSSLNMVLNMSAAELACSRRPRGSVLALVQTGNTDPQELHTG